jgi:hypothetical protein
MNCFNIRELQGILKRKFFPDLINITDHRNLMETSMIGLRFKYNTNDAIRPEQSLFYNFGTTNTSKQKNYTLVNYVYTGGNGYETHAMGTIGGRVMSALINNPASTPLNTPILKSYALWTNEIFNFIMTTSLYSCIASVTSISHIKSFFNQNLNVYLPINLTGSVNLTTNNTSVLSKKNYLFSTGNINSSGYDDHSALKATETTSMVRFNKHSNALVGYDYKSGHYLGI